jgi:diguanylate cyclase (GGDEF)-like protein
LRPWETEHGVGLRRKPPSLSPQARGYSTGSRPEQPEGKPMHLTAALNVVLGSAVLIILIIIDYIRKYNTDSYQRELFLSLLFFTFAAMAVDFVFLLIHGNPDTGITFILKISLLLYYFFQVLAYFHVFLFVDYITFKNQRRTELVKTAVGVLNGLHLVILLANDKWPFYYYVAPGNTFHYGNLYFIRLVISFLPVLFAVIDIFSQFKNFKKSSLVLILFFLFFTGTASLFDIIYRTVSLVWPCFSAGLLYTYFFIIQNDSKIDALTGLGNRYSFNEFINKLDNSKRYEFHNPFRPRRRRLESYPFKRRKSPEAYAVVMIDMDHFKEINDTLGHLEGDNALRDMAQIIKNCIRQSDFAARYGGDEFVLATRAEHNVAALLNRMQAAIDELNAKNERPYKLQISYGFDVYSAASGMSINDFLKHIDSLMYKHKNERRRLSDKKEGEKA